MFFPIFFLLKQTAHKFEKRTTMISLANYANYKSHQSSPINLIDILIKYY